MNYPIHESLRPWTKYSICPFCNSDFNVTPKYDQEFPSPFLGCSNKENNHVVLFEQRNSNFFDTMMFKIDDGNVWIVSSIFINKVETVKLTSTESDLLIPLNFLPLNLLDFIPKIKIFLLFQ